MLCVVLSSIINLALSLSLDIAHLSREQSCHFLAFHCYKNHLLEAQEEEITLSEVKYMWQKTSLAE